MKEKFEPRQKLQLGREQDLPTGGLQSALLEESPHTWAACPATEIPYSDGTYTARQCLVRNPWQGRWHASADFESSSPLHETSAHFTPVYLHSNLTGG